MRSGPSGTVNINDEIKLLYHSLLDTIEKERLIERRTADRKPVFGEYNNDVTLASNMLQELQEKFIDDFIKIIGNEKTQNINIDCINFSHLEEGGLKLILRDLKRFQKKGLKWDDKTFSINFLQPNKKQDLIQKEPFPKDIPTGPERNDEYEYTIGNLITKDVLDNYKLEEQEITIKGMRDKDPVPYGVVLKESMNILNDKEVPTNEMNIFFMGTGGQIHFAGIHEDVYEGGDILCHLGLNKGIKKKQPTMLIRGLGAYDVESTLDFVNNPASLTGGSAWETVAGGGISVRLGVAMEQFFIPTLLKMTDKKIKKTELPCDFTFNVVGHSRGAITSYSMVDFIDVWMKDIKGMDEKALKALAYKIDSEFQKATAGNSTKDKKTIQTLEMSFDEIHQALKAIQENQVNFKTKLMIYDPVEGRAAIGDNVRSYIQTWKEGKKFLTTVNREIFGRDLTCDYGHIPSSVKEAQIFIGADERRQAFQPTISQAENKDETNVAIMPVLGVHGTMKGYFSVFADTGQYSYKSIHKLKDRGVFLHEALKASADLVKVKSTRFLFDVLPPFDKITLYNAFYNNSNKGYVNTRNHLLNKITQLLEEHPLNEDLVATIDGAEMANKLLKNNDLTTLSHEKFIDLCQWVMNSEPELTKQLYVDLERDIHEIYLSPKEEWKAKQLAKLRDEMRKDTHLVLLLDEPDKERTIWVREKGKQNIGDFTKINNNLFHYLAYDPFSSIWYPSSPGIGIDAKDYIMDPYYFNLLSLFNDDQIDDNLKKLSYDFADLMEKGGKYMTNGNAKSLKEYTVNRDKFVNTLMVQYKSLIPQEMKRKIISVIVLKDEYQFKLNANDRILDRMINKANNPDGVKGILSHVFDYQMNEAIHLMKHEEYSKNPRSYKEAINLLEKIKDAKNNLELDVSETEKFKEIQKLLNKRYNLVQQHLEEDLNVYNKVLQGINSDSNPAAIEFDKKIKSLWERYHNANMGLDHPVIEYLSIHADLHQYIKEASESAMPRGMFETDFKKLLDKTKDEQDKKRGDKIFVSNERKKPLMIEKKARLRDRDGNKYELIKILEGRGQTGKANFYNIMKEQALIKQVLFKEDSLGTCILEGTASFVKEAGLLPKNLEKSVNFASVKCLYKKGSPIIGSIQDKVLPTEGEMVTGLDIVIYKAKREPNTVISSEWWNSDDINQHISSLDSDPQWQLASGIFTSMVAGDESIHLGQFMATTKGNKVTGIIRIDFGARERYAVARSLGQKENDTNPYHASTFYQSTGQYGKDYVKFLLKNKSFNEKYTMLWQKISSSDVLDKIHNKIKSESKNAILKQFKNLPSAKHKSNALYEILEIINRGANEKGKIKFIENTNMDQKIEFLAETISTLDLNRFKGMIIQVENEYDNDLNELTIKIGEFTDDESKLYLQKALELHKELLKNSPDVKLLDDVNECIEQINLKINILVEKLQANPEDKKCVNEINVACTVAAKLLETVHLAHIYEPNKFKQNNLNSDLRKYETYKNVCAYLLECSPSKKQNAAEILSKLSSSEQDFTKWLSTSNIVDELSKHTYNPSVYLAQLTGESKHVSKGSRLLKTIFGRYGISMFPPDLRDAIEMAKSLAKQNVNKEQIFQQLAKSVTKLNSENALTQDEEGKTLLHYLMAHADPTNANSMDAIKSFLSNYIYYGSTFDLDIKDYEGNTPLNALLSNPKAKLIIEKIDQACIGAKTGLGNGWKVNQIFIMDKYDNHTKNQLLINNFPPSVQKIWDDLQKKDYESLQKRPYTDTAEMPLVNGKTVLHYLMESAQPNDKEVIVTIVEILKKTISQWTRVQNTKLDTYVDIEGHSSFQLLIKNPNAEQIIKSINEELKEKQVEGYLSSGDWKIYQIDSFSNDETCIENLRRLAKSDSKPMDKPIFRL